MTIAKAGKPLCVTEGKYSDYQVLGFFVVLRDFDPKAEYAEFNPKAEKDSENAAFLAALIAKGLLLEVEFGALYIDTYHSGKSVSFTPA